MTHYVRYITLPLTFLQFGKLARKLQSRDEPQYEGLCHLAVARCERSLGNHAAEAEAIVVAARSFMKAEEKTRCTGCLSLEDHFQAAIQNYSRAIETQVCLAQSWFHF